MRAALPLAALLALAASGLAVAGGPSADGPAALAELPEAPLPAGIAMVAPGPGRGAPALAPALAAPEPAEAPDLTGPSAIVGRAAALAAQPGLDAEALVVLAAEQQLHAALAPQAPGAAWTLDRLLPEAPSLPAASVAPPTPLPASLAAPARAAVLAAGAAGALGLVFPKLPFLPFYSRIQREEAMLNARRSQLYELVRAEPGIHLSDLVRRSGLGWGAALYHLGVLEKNRVLVVHAQGGFKRYFANGAQPRDAMPRLAALRHDASRMLFDAVLAWPGRSGRDLADELGLSPSTLARASDRLEEAGLVRRVRAGRRVLYYPAEPPAPPAGPAPPGPGGLPAAAAS